MFSIGQYVQFKIGQHLSRGTIQSRTGNVLMIKVAPGIFEMVYEDEIIRPLGA